MEALKSKTGSVTRVSGVEDSMLAVVYFWQIYMSHKFRIVLRLAYKLFPNELKAEFYRFLRPERCGKL